MTTDVDLITQAVREAQAAASREERIRHHVRAAETYGGDLLPWLYDDWTLQERERLASDHVRILNELVVDLEAIGQRERALGYALRAAAALPYDESVCATTIRLYAAIGRFPEAARHYRTMKARLKREIGTGPGAELRTLARALGIGSGVKLPIESPRALPIQERPPTGSPPKQPPVPKPTFSLPIKLTRFVGREPELSLLTHRLVGPSNSEGEASIPRLLTLTGLGGSGKTRLALEAARLLAPGYAPALYFVPLAAVASPTGIAAALLDHLPLPRATGAAPIRQILDTLSARPALLVLDNFEHLLPDGTAFVQMLLRQVPSLTCLVTSRQPLGLDGEQEVPVSPLPVPLGAAPAAQVITFASVELFVDRAQAVLPDFQVTPRNAAAVATLCARLEGLPLAIELAAARARTLTPAQMLAQLLVDRFGFLVSRRPDSEPRHATLHATLDWSCQPLFPRLKRMLGQLSVFRGGWTLAAAQEICAAPDALPLLEQLRERSLITAQEAGGEMRYQMLEMVREYASALPTDAEALRERHSRHFLALAERAESALRGTGRAEWLERLELELDNLRAAGGASSSTRAQIGGALWRFWIARGYLHEGRTWLREALSADQELPPAIRARALQGAGVLARHQGDFYDAASCLLESLALYEQREDAQGMAEVLGHLGVLANEQGDYDIARGHQERALSLLTDLGDLRGIATAHNGIGQTAHNQGDFPTAAFHYEQSAQIYRRLGDAALQAVVTSNQAAISFERGEYAGARMLYEECLNLFRSQGNRVAVAVTLHNLGETCFRQGETAEARRLLCESVRLRHALGNAAGLVRSLATLGCVEGALGAYDRGARLLAAAHAQRVHTATVLPARESLTYETERARLETLLSPPAFRASWTAGLAMSLEQAVDFALSEDVAPATSVSRLS